MFYVVSYDISDDKRRLRMAKTLLDFGDRVQHSVFECRLDEAGFARMDKRLDRIMENMDKEDSVRIYFLCAQCEKSVAIKGRKDIPRKEKTLII